MAVNYGVNLANGEIIGTSNTTLFTASTDIVRVSINQARLVNYSAAPAIVSLYILQSGDSIADNFKAIDALTIAAHTEVIATEIIGDALDAGGTIVAISDTGTAVSFSATGTEFTA